MKLEIKGLTEFNVKLDKLQSLLNNAHIAAQIASDARAMIAGRTALGLDVNDKKFDKYDSEKTYYRDPSIRPKGKRGRTKRKGGGKELHTIVYDGGYAEFAKSTKRDGFPNLFASGDMMRSMQAKEKGRGESALVHFTRKNAALKAMVNNAKRIFMGINPKTEEPKLMITAGKLIDKAVRKAGL